MKIKGQRNDENPITVDLKITLDNEEDFNDVGMAFPYNVPYEYELVMVSKDYNEKSITLGWRKKYEANF